MRINTESCLPVLNKIEEKLTLQNAGKALVVLGIVGVIALTVLLNYNKIPAIGPLSEKNVLMIADGSMVFVILAGFIMWTVAHFEKKMREEEQKAHTILNKIKNPL